ncbi:sporulation protein YtxC [Paenibacillus marinisediminis]
MELFTISVSNGARNELESLSRLLMQEMDDLHTQANGVILEKFDSGSSASITCSGRLPGFQLALQAQDVWNRAARALAEYILSVKELPLLRELIKKEKNIDPSDVEKIEAYCIQLLNGMDDSTHHEARKRRCMKLRKVLFHYLEEHTQLHIDGFIRFRLDSYVTELREVVAYAMDEYVLERQYQEFISLLKYFVFIQDTKIPLAHLVHKGGHEFTLLNEQWLPLESSHIMDGMVVETIDCDMEMEDMIVSTLIHVSPGHIVIHTCEPESQVIKTIEQIFEARVHVCGYCPSCAAFLNPNWTSQDQCT